MTGKRGLVSALAVSLALHGAAVVALYELGLGRPPAPPGVASLAPVVLDLIEPVVVVPGRGVADAVAAAPQRRPSSGQRPGQVPAGIAATAVGGPPSGESVPSSRVREPSDSGLPGLPAPLRAGDGLPTPVPPPPPVPARSPGLDVPPTSAETGERGDGEGRPVAPASDGSRGGDDSAGGPRVGPWGSARGPVETAALPDGRGTPIPPEYDGYVRGVRQRIQERLVYPWLAVRQRVRGTVELELRVDPEGRLASVSVVGGEGAGILRDAAVRAVRDATPFPSPPGVAARALTIRLPVVFELK